MGLYDRALGAVIGFAQGWLNADAQRTQLGSFNDFDAFSQYESRQFRYDLFWSMYQNNSFSDVMHRWSQGLKAQFSLYKHTKNLLNPTRMIVDTWPGFVCGGPLDPAAGDGTRVKSALPIECDDEAIRTAIAAIWAPSRWGIKKSTWARFGANLGDVFLKIDDDPSRGRVTQRVVHPGHVKWMRLDDAGNVLEYILEETRYDPRAMAVRNLNPVIDPRSLRRTVVYNEECWVEGGVARYRTYLNGGLFDWRKYCDDGEEMPAEWEVPYPFCPLVPTQHQDIGIDYGMAEPHGLISRVLELDDLASGLGDQTRKSIRAPHMISGITNRAELLANRQPGQADPCAPMGSAAPDREQMPILAVKNEHARAQSLVIDIDYEGIGQHLERINRTIEKEYPELQLEDIQSGKLSGRALREARRRVVIKVQERRPAYDESLVKAHKLAMMIGSIRGYPGFEGIRIGDPGDLDQQSIAHTIAHRPVFEVDPLDDIEQGKAFWDQVAVAVQQCGVPVDVMLRREGWDEPEIAELMAAKEKLRQQAMETAGAKGGKGGQKPGDRAKPPDAKITDQEDD